MMHYMMILEVTTASKENEEFKNRKRHKDDARDHACGNMHTAKVPAKVHQRKEEIQSVNDAVMRISNILIPHKKMLLIMLLSLIMRR